MSKFLTRTWQGPTASPNPFFSAIHFLSLSPSLSLYVHIYTHTYILCALLLYCQVLSIFGPSQYIPEMLFTQMSAYLVYFCQRLNSNFTFTDVTFQQVYRFITVPKMKWELCLLIIMKLHLNLWVYSKQLLKENYGLINAFLIKGKKNKKY